MEVEEITAKILEEWAPGFITRLQDKAEKVPKLTGEGVLSFSTTVSRGRLLGLLLRFNAYLRFYDMRRVEWRNMPNIDALKEFIEKKGVESFTPKFRDKYGYVPKSSTQLVNQLAWGIGISIAKRGRMLAKRKPWYNKQKEGSINYLYEKLLSALADQYLKDTKESLQSPS